MKTPRLRVSTHLSRAAEVATRGTYVVHLTVTGVDHEPNDVMALLAKIIADGRVLGAPVRLEYLPVEHLGKVFDSAPPALS
jgi:hypothetical protein